MTIKIGDKIPSITLNRLGENGMESVEIASYVAGRKVVLFAVPGAFTPSCAQRHLPGYIEQSSAIKAKGIDEIICVSVNDPFVMKHWGDAAGAAQRVTMMPDGNGDFTRAVGLSMDGSGFGLGQRSQRYSMVIDNGVVRELHVEKSASDVDVSAANACLVRLAG